MKKLLAIFALGSLLALGCGGNESSATTNLTVFGASSLTEALPELASAFKEDHPEASFNFSFGSSSDLAAQILEGAPVDVFASADDSNMEKVVAGGEALGTPTSFARNTFAIIVAKGNPKAIAGISDLASADLLVVTCVETAPCGKGALAILANAGVRVVPKSYEEKVKGVVTKVTSGEADAGIVYVTDVLAADASADGVDIPSNINVVNNYPVVVTKESNNAALAQQFIDFIASKAGQTILARYGFLAP